MYFLSEETAFTAEFEDWAVPVSGFRNAGVFWQRNVHTAGGRLGLVVQAGVRAVLESVEIQSQDAGVWVTGAALPAISSDGLDLRLLFRCSAEGHEFEVARTHIPGFDPGHPWIELPLNLTALHGRSGRFIIECGPGANGDPCADWAATYELAISGPEQLSLTRARAFKAWKTENEIAHFTATAAMQPRAPANSFDLRITPAQRYSGRMIEKLQRHPIPRFVERLVHKASAIGRGSPLRVLSLCSGLADKEEMLLRRVPGDCVRLTLVDITPDIVMSARERLSKYCEVSAVACDVNSLDLSGEKYDVILAAAGLHHLVELEHISKEVSHGLLCGGEFWAIGEYIGRPGARLWPDAYTIANEHFARLPARLRSNSLRNGEPDFALPNPDCSIATFEGIRAPEIVECLERELIPLQATAHGCFVWRLYDYAYANNYDLRRREDCGFIRAAASLDVDYQKSGGRPSVLNAIYGRR